MVFSGIPFLYYFLPFVIIAYFVAPPKVRNGVLLAASLFFYAWGEPVYVLLMLFSVVLGYLGGIAIEKKRLLSEKNGDIQRGLISAKVIFAGTVSVFVLIFVFFKYTDFLLENVNICINALGGGAKLPLPGIVLPIGISFYTFQIISYLADVYRGDARAQRNFVSLALYIAMFPQLIAGPIVRYGDMERQLENRKTTWEKAEQGIGRFVTGLAKKVLLANELGLLCEIFRSSGDKSVLFYWMYAIAFTLQIYFDFSGYSDMAIGLGRLFGFELPENFRYPYLAGSITEFWRRWHISLGSWFRDYVYIPLGGNRVSRIKWYRNILVVWMLTGLWHGSAWNFLIWGLYFGLLLVLEKNMPDKWRGRLGAGKYVYTLFLIIIGFVIFNARGWQEAVCDLGCMLGMGGLPFCSGETIYYLQSFGVTFLVAMVGCTPLPAGCAERIGQRWKKPYLIGWVAVLVFFWILSTAYLADAAFNPFLYFRF